MDTGSTGASDSESDLLLGILDILDPELFLKGSLAAVESQDGQLVLPTGPQGVPVCPASPATLGAAPVKLEAHHELIHFDHIYTKHQVVQEEEEAQEEVVCVVEESVQEVKLEDDEEQHLQKRQDVEEEDYEEDDEEDDDEDEEVAFSPAAQEEVVVEMEEDVSVKDEPEEVLLPETAAAGAPAGSVDDFLPQPSPSLASYGKASAYLADAYSDSGYERSPSPFSNMSSPLCSESSWEDVFANELFPQLISV